MYEMLEINGNQLYTIEKSEFKLLNTSFLGSFGWEKCTSIMVCSFIMIPCLYGHLTEAFKTRENLPV
jgi:hypothetical protein